MYVPERYGELAVEALMLMRRKDEEHCCRQRVLFKGCVF
jgi:hypothetical protein